MAKRADMNIDSGFIGRGLKRMGFDADDDDDYEPDEEPEDEPIDDSTE